MKASKALVFDKKRFAIHDGTGIRTTIFFKGCPLHCVWCQNPEGISPQRNLLYFENRCIHCRRCEQNAYPKQMEYINGRPQFTKEYTGGFENLVKACPANAIRYDSEYYQIEELITCIQQDEIFYKFGGGVTFSGGEPFMQEDFLVALLKRCKQEHIHTAIETSLCVSCDILQQALPYIDLLYADMKLFDEEEHKKYVGCSAKLIQDNLRYIIHSEHHHKLVIRTPLIPDYTATKQNILAISKFIADLNPNIPYELLNYNPLAASKYSLVDFTYGVDEHHKPFSKDELQDFYTLARTSGLRNILIE